VTKTKTKIKTAD